MGAERGWVESHDFVRQNALFQFRCHKLLIFEKAVSNWKKFPNFENLNWWPILPEIMSLVWQHCCSVWQSGKKSARKINQFTHTCMIMPDFFLTKWSFILSDKVPISSDKMIILAVRKISLKKKGSKPYNWTLILRITNHLLN